MNINVSFILIEITFETRHIEPNLIVLPCPSRFFALQGVCFLVVCGLVNVYEVFLHLRVSESDKPAVWDHTRYLLPTMLLDHVRLHQMNIARLQ